MSDLAIFAIGSVIFTFTTWATFSFGLRRMAELQARELDESNVVVIKRDDGLTELHVARSAEQDEMRRKA